MFRRLYQANGDNNPDFFSVPQRQFDAGIVEADMKYSEVDLTQALATHAKAKGRFPAMGHDDLAQNYPVLYQSLLQLVHTTGERINKTFSSRPEK